MKHELRSLTWAAMAAVVAAGVVCSLVARGQESGVRSQQAAIESDPRLPIPNAPGSLVAEAARRVAAEPAISAEMRFKIDAFGHELIGTGNYSQLGAGPEKLLRLDLRMQVGDRPAIVQEIRGEELYWVRRDVPPLPPSLSRVDLKLLRKSLARSSLPAAGDVLPQGEWIMLGGLARLLTALDESFAFAAPRAEELRFNSAEGKSFVKLPIWVVSGQWKPEKIAALTGREKGKAGPLPDQLPERVELVLGRSDDVLPLFPYRITYWRSAASDAKSAKDAQPQPPRELLTLELFNVSRRGIDRREFEYQPGDQEVQDLTQHYVQRYSETKLR
jgi:hypothetical protein